MFIYELGNMSYAALFFEILLIIIGILSVTKVRVLISVPGVSRIVVIWLIQ